MTQQEVAEWLNLSVRQVKRLWRGYREGGATALLSRRRGRPSNHQLAPEVKAAALALIQEHYSDFGPTLAQEKLCHVHELRLSVESVRQLMIGAGLWRVRRVRRAVVHPLRERRERYGELVQIDGSPHAWFESRGPRCTLLVFIDDATGRYNHLEFVAAETTWAYLNATRAYVQSHGRPLAFYSDKHTIFRSADAETAESSGVTQYGRALQELDIGLLCANTPQAKGRVERANKTLQDRLVKELRLQGINDMEAANHFLLAFMADLNKRFAHAARSPEDAHRSTPAAGDMARIFTLVEARVLSKNLSLQYKNVIYQIQTSRPAYALRHKTVLVRETQEGIVTIEYQNQALNYTIFQHQSAQAKVVTAKEIATMELKPPAPPNLLPPLKTGLRSPSLKPDHPWKRNPLIPRRTHALPEGT